MTAEGLRMAAITVAGLAALGLAVAGAQQGPPIDELVIQPVAPPLTRIAALGDAPLAAPPTPPGAPPHGPPPGPPLGASGAPPAGHVLRLQVQADAIAMAEVLGPARVDAAVARREALSAMVGEGATWAQLVSRLEARAAAP